MWKILVTHVTRAAAKIRAIRADDKHGRTNPLAVVKKRIRAVSLFLILAVWLGVGQAADFSFESHWAMPIPLQGDPPAGFSDLEKSLYPEDCGTCHDTQFEDWKTSRHSISMGPGVTGQFGKPWLDPVTTELCFDCHAPLGEQRIYTKNGSRVLPPNKHRDPALASKGLTCAACHVRKHERYGPSPRAEKVEDPPHNGFTEVKNFGSASFCKPCHQFDPTDRRMDGKLLEDTYNQWEKSRFSKEGVQCANCHMPDRRHLWRGIHDPEMVKKGVSVTAIKKGDTTRVTIANTGVGHYFPTYVTPQVVVQASIMTRDGVVKVLDTKNIGWYLELDLSGARFDTRIPPGKSWQRAFTIPPGADDGFFSVSVTVYPDDFYNRFFKALIANPPAGVDSKKLAEALEKTEQSSFTLFRKSWKLE